MRGKLWQKPRSFENRHLPTAFGGMLLPSETFEDIKVLEISINRQNKRLLRALLDSLGGEVSRTPRCRQDLHSV